MPTIRELKLYVSTRDVQWGNSNDRLRLFSRNVEVAHFTENYNAIPEKGMTRLLMKNDVRIDYDDFITGSIELGIDGNDAWAPRQIFLYGILEEENKIVPLGHRIGLPPFRHWLSQDLNDIPGHTSKKIILKNTPEADEIDSLVLTYTFRTETSGHTKGPIQLSMFGNFNNVPGLVYQTLLPKIGRSKPGDKTHQWWPDSYMVFLPMVALTGSVQLHKSNLVKITIVNLSDDSWAVPYNMVLFGLSHFNNNCTTIFSGGDGILSLDEHDIPTGADFSKEFDPY